MVSSSLADFSCWGFWLIMRMTLTHTHKRILKKWHKPPRKYLLLIFRMIWTRKETCPLSDKVTWNGKGTRLLSCSIDFIRKETVPFFHHVFDIKSIEHERRRIPFFWDRITAYNFRYYLEVVLDCCFLESITGVQITPTPRRESHLNKITPTTSQLPSIYQKGWWKSWMKRLKKKKKKKILFFLF